MRFFRNSCVIPVLDSSCILYTLRTCAREFLALIAMEGMYAGFASLQGCSLLGQCRSNCRGAKACRGKITIFKSTFDYGLLTSPETILARVI